MTSRIAHVTLVISGLLIGACSTPQLTPMGRGVIALGTPPVGHCRALGMVIGNARGPYSPQSLVYATNDARNHAAELGATHVVTTPPAPEYSALYSQEVNSVTLTGSAYRCGGGPEAAQTNVAGGEEQARLAAQQAAEEARRAEAAQQAAEETRRPATTQQALQTSMQPPPSDVHPGADLHGRDLTDARFEHADLRRANLSGTRLTGARLTGANLSGANLSGARITVAYLSGANLSGANLSGVHLMGSVLTGANLTGAHLTGADLTGADLTGARLHRANLRGVNLSETIGCMNNPRCPAAVARREARAYEATASAPHPCYRQWLAVIRCDAARRAEESLEHACESAPDGPGCQALESRRRRQEACEATCNNRRDATHERVDFGTISEDLGACHYQCMPANMRCDRARDAENACSERHSR